MPVQPNTTLVQPNTGIGILAKQTARHLAEYEPFLCKARSYDELKSCSFRCGSSQSQHIIDACLEDLIAIPTTKTLLCVAHITHTFNPRHRIKLFVSSGVSDSEPSQNWWT